MTKASKKFTPPFAWLGRFWIPVGLTAITLTAAFFRFYQLAALPPGLDNTSAQIGLQALHLSSTHWIPTLSAVNGYAPLWVWLQSISVHIFGNSELSLRLWPAILGTLAVIVTWLWVNDWFNRRIAWIAAMLMAVSPWAVTISRNGVESALLPLLTSLTLWLAGRAWRAPSTRRMMTLGAGLGLNLLAGPLGWLLTGTILAIGLWLLATRHKLGGLTRHHLAASIPFAAGAGLLAYFIGTSLPGIKSMPHDLGIAANVGQIFQNIAKVVVMFNIHGDENYHHNLAGEPLLNAFVGLMFVTGILVSVSRLHERRYRLLLGLLVVLVAPATLAVAGLPNSSYAVAALPIVFAVAGVGTSYMLELWYATFPINSAARTTGQAAIILLLALSFLQGYTQYFRAWAGSTAVYVAYNEGSVQIGKHLKTDRTGERYVIAPADQAPIIEYIATGITKPAPVIQPAALQALPLSTTARQYYIATASRDEAVKILKAKFPGGILRPHYSNFNQVEIYYTYEAAK